MVHPGKACAGSLLFLVCYCCGGVAQQNTSSFPVIYQQRAIGQPTPGGTAEDLLKQSYILGAEFVAAERRANLLRLVQVASKIRSPQARTYAEELFNAAKDLPQEANAAALQKTVVVLFSAADLDGAFEMLQRMNPPSSAPEGGLAWDARAQAAAIIFPELWDRAGSPALDRLRLEAQRLGETGQYPFAGMRPVISSLLQTDPDTGVSLFIEALTYYRRGSRDFSADEDFIDFVRNAKDKVPQPLVRDALHVTISNILEKAKAEARETQSVYTVKIHTDKGSATFQSRADELLFQLLPMLRQADPASAERLVETRPALAYARAIVGEVQFRERTVVHTQGRTVNITPALEQGLELSRFAQVRVLSEKKPEEALKLSLSLQDPGLRSAALGYVAAAVATQDLKKTTQLMRQAQQLLPEVRGQLDRVRTLASLARAAAAIRESAGLTHLLRQGLDLGVEVFQEEMDTHPGWTAFHSEVLDYLSELVRIGARTDKDYIVGYVQGLQNNVLKAWLLLDVAEVLARPNPSSPTTQQSPAQTKMGN